MRILGISALYDDAHYTDNGAEGVSIADRLDAMIWADRTGR